MSLSSHVRAEAWWKPDGLKKNIVEALISHVEKTTPYRIDVQSVSGNFFKVFTLNGVKVRAEGIEQDLMTIQSVQVDLRWKSVIQKKIDIQSVIFENPVLKLRIGKNKKLELPEFTKDRNEEGEPDWNIERIELRKGQILITNRSVQPAQEIDIKTVDLEGRLLPERLEIRNVRAALGAGGLQGTGEIVFGEIKTVDLALRASAFPLQQLYKLQGKPPQPLRLGYSGEMKIQMSSDVWKLASRGRLEDAPLTASMEGSSKGMKDVRLGLESASMKRLWAEPLTDDPGVLSVSLKGSNTHPGYQRMTAHGQARLARATAGPRPAQSANVTVDLTEGRGPMLATVQSEGLKGSASAKLDLPGESSQGEFTLMLSSFTGLAEFASALVNAQGIVEAKGSWNGPLSGPILQVTANGKDFSMEGKHIEAVTVNAQGQWGSKAGVNIEARLTELQWAAGRKQPWDVKAMDLKMKGVDHTWDPDLTTTFRNEARMEYLGSFKTVEEGWTLTWNKWKLHPKKGPTLEVAQPGELSRDARGVLRLKGLTVAGGKGRLVVDRATYLKPDIDLQVTSNDWDPSALAVFVTDGKIDSGGYVRLNAQIKGPYPKVKVDGQLQAEMPRLEIPELGLDLRKLSVDVASREKEIEVKRFTAKTKKGDIEITGKSTLPALDFRAVGRRVVVQKKKEIDAEGNFRLHLEGDLDNPKLTGVIRLTKGTYRLPQKTRKQKEEEKRRAVANPSMPSPLWESLAMNVRAEWSRNVWYRDGLSKVETSADLRIQKEKGAPTPYLYGSISIVRGSYDAYGRDFSLTSGDIAFTGPPEINPVLNIQAEYKSGGTIVYLDVKGTAKAPEIALRSNPPLAQQDIVSVLVLGRPLNQIRPDPAGPTTGSSGQAEALAGSVLSSMITRELRENGLNLGLDVVRIEPTTTGNVLMVGRYIGTNLFVAYGQPLQATATRAYEASYYISQNWTMVGESGTPDTAQANPTAIDNHLGLEFRYPLNTPKVKRLPRDGGRRNRAE